MTTTANFYLNTSLKNTYIRESIYKNRLYTIVQWYPSDENGKTKWFYYNNSNTIRNNP